MLGKRLFVAAALALGLVRTAAAAPPAAPDAIKIGTLYAGTGAYASISLTAYRSLQWWTEMQNSAGGVYVKAYDKKIPIKLIAYDDQSSTGTAATLYNQLITQDHVDILVADSGSVLTATAVPIARDHKMLLIDQTGTSPGFFSADNPYIVLVSAMASNYWSKILGGFMTEDAAKLGVKRVAIIYATNDFTTAQANGVREMIKADPRMTIVYDHGVPTDTSNYAVLLSNIAATNPDAVLNLGYPGNDIAFFRAVADSGQNFKMLFGIYVGVEYETVSKNVGPKYLNQVLAYMPPSMFENPVNIGMTLAQFQPAWTKKFAGQHMEFGYNAVAGYNTGLVLERALATADSLDQMALRRAIMAESGELKTLAGTLELTKIGEQYGLKNLVGQIEIDKAGHESLVPVYPADEAKGKVVYPRTAGE